MEAYRNKFLFYHNNKYARERSVALRLHKHTIVWVPSHTRKYAYVAPWSSRLQELLIPTMLADHLVQMRARYLRDLELATV